MFNSHLHLKSTCNLGLGSYFDKDDPMLMQSLSAGISQIRPTSSGGIWLPEEDVSAGGGDRRGGGAPTQFQSEPGPQLNPLDYRPDC